MDIKETIAAISTSTSGSGGIGIIRLSGPDSIKIADNIFRSANNKILDKVPTHTIHYGKIVENGQEIDEVLVSVMKAPNTYTKEDVVEINCHGGMLVMKKVLEACVNAGARIAEPGEFTKRAFLNGRIDLSQAEAVIDIINSQNDYALKASVNQLDGNLSKKIREIRELIMDNIAFIEAALDDPEHISLENYVDKLSIDVDKSVDNIEKMCKTTENGRIIKSGINTCILGKPNAGKSSLLNTLARYERAIVTDVEGTTRDVIEEQINLDGVTLNLMDTAGIRNTEDIVEKIGVDKSKEMAANADLIIYVVDGSRDLDDNDEEIIKLIKGKKCIVLLNKSDLLNVISKEYIQEKTGFEVVTVSAKTNEGIDDFSNLVKAMFYDGSISVNDELVITNMRHKMSLTEALKSLMQVKTSIENNMPEDFFSIDLMSAYEHLGMIIGEQVEEDLVNTIFSKFCMGK